MKKLTLIIVLIIMTFALSSCSVLTAVLEEMAASENKETTDLEVNEQVILNDDSPKLPDLDFSNMELLDDGYAIAEYRTNPDGDTATFIVDGTPFVTRFLAIDTPEMNYEENNPDAWAPEALAYTENALKNADTIILEIDYESDVFDDYDRLLAWIWADGELLNYQLVSRGLAYVKYLYGDYKYNDVLLEAERTAEDMGVGLWGGNPMPQTGSTNSGSGTASSGSNSTVYSVYDAREMSIGSQVTISGVVTNIVGTSAFIEDKTGGMYIFAKKEYKEIKVGNEILITGELTDYNNLLELKYVGDRAIEILNSNLETQPKEVSLGSINESIESHYIRVNNLTITDIAYGTNGYNIYVTDGKDDGVIRIDKYLEPYPDASFVSVGDRVDVVGNVAQHMDSYQIMIGSEDDVIIK